METKSQWGCLRVVSLEAKTVDFSLFHSITTCSAFSSLFLTWICKWSFHQMVYWNSKNNGQVRVICRTEMKTLIRESCESTDPPLAVSSGAPGSRRKMISLICEKDEWGRISQGSHFCGWLATWESRVISRGSCNLIHTSQNLFAADCSAMRVPT